MGVDPLHVAPIEVIHGAVRVALGVALLVVNPVRTDPFERWAFQTANPAKHEQFFEPARELHRPVRQEPVVGQVDPDGTEDGVPDQQIEREIPREEWREERYWHQ